MPRQSPIVDQRRAANTERKTRTLTLIISRRCTLKCKRCFEKSNLRGDEIMDFKVAQEAIKYFMELDDGFNFVLIDLFGGEPLCAYSLIKDIFHWCRSQHWKKQYHFVIGTNGTLLNDEIKEWFSRNREYFTMALSIDGNRTAHNISRDNSYDIIYPHIEFFKKNWPDQPAKMTIFAETIPYMADSIIELEEMGLNFTANLAFENSWGDAENKKGLLQTYEEQLGRLTVFYKENTHLSPVYPLLGKLPFYLGIPGFEKNQENGCVRFCGSDHEMVTVDTDGNRCGCHRFLPWVTGKEPPDVPVNRQTSWKPGECAECKIRHSCPTCAGFNWEENGDTGIRTTYHCEAHKLEVLAAARIAADRFGKIPDSYLYSLTQEERRAFKDRVRAVRDLVANGI